MSLILRGRHGGGYEDAVLQSSRANATNEWFIKASKITLVDVELIQALNQLLVGLCVLLQDEGKDVDHLPNEVRRGEGVEQSNESRANDLEGFEIVNHVGMDHGAHLDLIVLRLDEVLVAREVDQVSAGLPSQSAASDHACSSSAGSAKEALVQPAEEATGQVGRHLEPIVDLLQHFVNA